MASSTISPTTSPSAFSTSTSTSTGSTLYAPVGLPTLSAYHSAPTDNTSVGLTVPTLIPNPKSDGNTTSTIPPFVSNQTKSTPEHLSPVYVIVPVVVGFICVVGLVALCSFIRWKRRHDPEATGWWSGEQEAGMGGGYRVPFEQGDGGGYGEVGKGVYELRAVAGTKSGTRRVDTWRRGLVVEEHEVLGERNREGERGAVGDEESLRLLVNATKGERGRDNEHLKSGGTITGGEEGEGMADTNVRVKTSERVEKTVRRDGGGRAELSHEYERAFGTASGVKAEVPMSVEKMSSICR